MFKRFTLLLSVVLLTVVFALPSEANTVKKTPLKDLLVIAIANNNPTLAQAAIKKGADVNSIKPSPLAVAIHEKNVPMVELLLQNGADPNQDIDRGTIYHTTPLLNAIKAQNIEIIRLLVDHGADVNLPTVHYANKDVLGVSPLTYAVTLTENRTGVEIVKYLIKINADVNYANSNGYTPIMAAANCDEFSRKRNVVFGVAKRLLRAGADPTIATVNGKTALDFAIDGDFTKMITLLSPDTDQE